MILPKIRVLAATDAVHSRSGRRGADLRVPGAARTDRHRGPRGPRARRSPLPHRGPHGRPLRARPGPLPLLRRVCAHAPRATSASRTTTASDRRRAAASSCTPGMERVPFDEGAVRPDVRRFFRQSLQLREVCAGGDGSVEMELNATGNVNFDLGRFGIGFTASPRHADGVAVSGPVTAAMAEALAICWEAVAEPKLLIACGTEACSGGLFAESRAIDRRFFGHPPPTSGRRAPRPTRWPHRRHPTCSDTKNATDHATPAHHLLLVLQDRALHLRRGLRHDLAHRARGHHTPPWIEQKEFLDLLTLAQSVPGPIAVNTSVFVGYKLRGLRGAAAAVLGTVRRRSRSSSSSRSSSPASATTPLSTPRSRGCARRSSPSSSGPCCRSRAACTGHAARHRRHGPAHLGAGLVADLPACRSRRAGHRLGTLHRKKG